MIQTESKCTLYVTSGNRTKKHNDEVGGTKGSYHLKRDRARDFVSLVKNPRCSIQNIAKIACKYATTIEYPKHIHIDNRKNKKCFKGSYND